MSEKLTPETIVNAVATEYKVKAESIKQKQQGKRQAKIARKVAIYCCQELESTTRKEIARFFTLSHLGSASMTIKTVKQELSLGRIKEMSRIYKFLNVVKPA